MTNVRDIFTQFGDLSMKKQVKWAQFVYDYVCIATFIFSLLSVFRTAREQITSSGTEAKLPSPIYYLQFAASTLLAAPRNWLCSWRIFANESILSAICTHIRTGTVWYQQKPWAQTINIKCRQTVSTFKCFKIYLYVLPNVLSRYLRCLVDLVCREKNCSPGTSKHSRKSHR